LLNAVKIKNTKNKFLKINHKFLANINSFNKSMHKLFSLLLCFSLLTFQSWNYTISTSSTPNTVGAMTWFVVQISNLENAIGSGGRITMQYPPQYDLSTVNPGLFFTSGCSSSSLSLDRPLN